ncbi:MAG: hypothetical protein ACE5EI_08520 [Thermodesulfobacteriota bacterium]
MDGRFLILTVWGGPAGAALTAALGGAAASGGSSVVLVDGAPGGGLSRLFGPGPALRPTGTDGLSLLGPVGGVFSGDDPDAMRALARRLARTGADAVIADLGGGSSSNVFDFFALSGEAVIVVEPQRASIQAGFDFLRGFVLRRLARLFADNPLVADIVTEATDASRPDCALTFDDLIDTVARFDPRSADRAAAEVHGFRPLVLLNNATSPDDARAAAVLKSAAVMYLGLDVEYIGAVSREDAPATFRAEVSALAERLLAGLAGAGTPGVPGREAPAVEPPEAFFEEPFGFNDDMEHKGRRFHVQTEVFVGAAGGGDPMVETAVYEGGRVLFSKKTRWSEARDQSDGATDIREVATRQHRAAIAAIRMDRVSAE